MEAYAADPVGTTWELSTQAVAQQQAAQQVQMDEARVAEQAAIMLANAQEQQAQAAEQSEVAKIVDRSMSAEYGAAWAELAPSVGAAIAADPQSISSATDAKRMLAEVDKVFLAVREKNDPSTEAWAKIKAASRGPGEYWKS